MPVRVQRRRVEGRRMPEGTVYVGRNTRWRNPFPAGQYLRSAQQGGRPVPEEVDAPRPGRDPRRVARQRAGLLVPLTYRHGNRVPCHSDVLLEIANAEGGA